MKKTRNLWPYGIITTFVLFFIGMASVVIIAATHRDNLVSADYYEQELKYQDQINATAQAEKAGATIQVNAATSTMLISVPAEQAQQNLTGKISLYRANAPELDREFVFAPGKDGTQTLDAAGFASGLWHVRVSWNAGGKNYFLEQKITL